MPNIESHAEFEDVDKDSRSARGWLDRRDPALILAAVALQVGLLAWMAIAASAPGRTGQTVLLQVVPVDPRDLFRGDYVILGYAFSQVGSLGDDAQGSPAYVTLVPEADGVHYRGELPSIAPPPPGTLHLRGTFDAPGRASFGIESYYVQEGTGRQYEQAVLKRKLWAEIAVAPNGQGAVQRLVIE